MQPELMRQHEAYKAVRERLFTRTKPKPRLVVLRDYDAHVLSWREWCSFREKLRSASTSATFSARFGSYPVFSTPLVLSEDSEIAVSRRSMKEICLDVLKQFPGVTLEDIKGSHRTRYVVAARHTCMHAIYTERRDISFPALGRFFGGRDHTSCLAAVRKMEKGANAWSVPAPAVKPRVSGRKLVLLPDELDFLMRLRNGKPLKSSGAKDRSQERPRNRMKNVGFAEFCKKAQRWVITPAGLEALKREKE